MQSNTAIAGKWLNVLCLNWPLQLKDNKFPTQNTVCKSQARSLSNSKQTICRKGWPSRTNILRDSVRTSGSCPSTGWRPSTWRRLRRMGSSFCSRQSCRWARTATTCATSFLKSLECLRSTSSWLPTSLTSSRRNNKVKTTSGSLWRRWSKRVCWKTKRWQRLLSWLRSDSTLA